MVAILGGFLGWSNSFLDLCLRLWTTSAQVGFMPKRAYKPSSFFGSELPISLLTDFVICLFRALFYLRLSFSLSCPLKSFFEVPFSCIVCIFFNVICLTKQFYLFDFFLKSLAILFVECFFDSIFILFLFDFSSL
jgi:hypothetical protein